MIYKVFYQETKTATFVVKRTHALYSILMHQMNAKDASKPFVNWLKKHRFSTLMITPLSEQHLAYEKESGAFELTYTSTMAYTLKPEEVGVFAIRLGGM